MSLPYPEPTGRETGKAKALIKLTGGPDAAPHPKAITRPGKGGKFTPEGQVLAFPGNTFLCHIDPMSDFFAALCAVQDRLRAHPLAAHFTFLPKPSFHMTIFCGVSGVPLGSDGWPKGFPINATLDQITGAYVDRLANSDFQTGFTVLPQDLFLPTSVSMRAATNQDEHDLRKIRADLEQLTGLVRGDVDSYGFHVSMAYVIKWLGEKDAQKLVEDCASLFDDYLRNCGPIHLDRVEFCTFETMHQFDEIHSF